MDCRIIEIDSMKTQNIKKTPYRLVLILLLFISELSSAQPPAFGEGDDVQDIPVASIDGPVILMLLVGVIGSFYLLRKKELTK
jgi:hypothetical protein